MAKQTITKVLDDLDGSEDATTVTFALADKGYEVDLSDANRERLEGALAEFVKVGQTIPVHYGSRGPKGPKPKQRAPRSVEKANNNEIRDWARQNGLQVSDRGRISREVLAAYEAAPKG